MSGNPYSLVFGKEPKEAIPRIAQTAEVIQWFSDDPPSQQICMIMGVRGSGKTVQMTTIGKHFAAQEDWVVVELNADGNILENLAAKLASRNSLAKIFHAAKINLSFFGIGLEVRDSVPITDLETAVGQMLTSLKKKKKKVLVSIDEVTNTPQMRFFAGAFQIFVRHDLPIYLLMTGLFENIYELQNQKSLTFLYRAPKIQLQPLNIGTMRENYQTVLGVSPEKALDMAKATRGYSFAFQVMGYLSWQYKGDDAKIQSLYKQYLEEYSYEKIWSEMSAGDRKLARAISAVPDGKLSDIKTLVGMENNEISPYRIRLIRKGIVNGEVRGYLRFTLPLFETFVQERSDLPVG